MAYATTLQVAERSGIGIRIVDENVGTGDNSETDFDLDHTNVFSTGTVLSHAASASNTFTTLTETTHYTLDDESGRVILTGSGVSEVGTDIIFATYWYNDTFPNSVISDMIDAADDEIDVWSGRKWDTATSVTERFNGRPSLGYPSTDRPYTHDFDAPSFLLLQNQPVTTVDFIYFLSKPLAISQFFNFDTGGSAYTDNTTAVTLSTEAPFTLFDDAPATGDIIYIGSSSRFLGLDVVLSTAGTDNGSTAIDWEYWNGTAWTDLSETAQTTGVDIFTSSGTMTWTFPYGWATTTVNSSDSLYFVRGTLTDDYSVDPIVSTITLLDPITQVVEKSSTSLRNSQLSFQNVIVPHGTDNIRVDYNYGLSTTPSYITELSVLIASIQAFITLSGGSFDDATSYSLGSKSVTIGEVYVNIREVLAQLQKRVDSLYKMIGKRAQVTAI